MTGLAACCRDVSTEETTREPVRCMELRMSSSEARTRLLSFVCIEPCQRLWTKHGLTEDDMIGLESEILAAPRTGDEVRGSGGFRKIRWRREGSGKGKSGSYRVRRRDTKNGFAKSRNVENPEQGQEAPGRGKSFSPNRRGLRRDRRTPGSRRSRPAPRGPLLDPNAQARTKPLPRRRPARPT